MLSGIYRVKTSNSFYEIQVTEEGRSRARKGDGPWKQVIGTSATWLDFLVIGASLKIPGCWSTSIVEDYQIYRPSDEPKHTTRATAGGIDDLIEAIVAPVRNHAVVVTDPPKAVVVRARS